MNDQDPLGSEPQAPQPRTLATDLARLRAVWAPRLQSALKRTPTDDGTPPESPAKRRKRILIFVAAVLSLLLVLMLGYGIYVYNLVNGIQKSNALGNVDDSNGVNLLVMGLDSRLDEQGHPLPSDIYNALHSGDESSGGLNSNVLMFIHIPAGGGPAVGFSIPRDDYVELAGCPSGECKGKIKEAYGLAVAQKQTELVRSGVKGAAAYQQARDAGRLAEIHTVENFLGVKVNRFVEVTMVAFFQLAQVVQPVTVCIKENTQDTYSGAQFKAGTQDLDAQQAVAFVRQRRDTKDPSLAFTDLDRARRQQAFLMALLVKLKSFSTLTSPGEISDIVKVVNKNMVVSEGLGPFTLASLAGKVSGGNLHFYTLPITGFGKDPAGQDVNLVDVPAVRATVASITNPNGTPAPGPTAPPTAPAHSPVGVTLSVTNASGVTGGARKLLDRFSAMGYTAGTISNAASSSSTKIRFAPGSEQAAQDLAAVLGTNVEVVKDSSLKAGHLQLVAGTDVITPSSSSTSHSSSSATPVKPVDGTGGGRSGPPPTALVQIQSGGIPCVK